MPDNPYMVGGAGAGGPNYAAPLLDWQGMAGGIGDALKQRQQQGQQPGQPGPPMNIRPPAQMQGMPPQGGQPNMPGGWGARLAQIFELGQMRPGMLAGRPAVRRPATARADRTESARSLLIWLAHVRRVLCRPALGLAGAGPAAAAAASDGEVACETTRTVSEAGRRSVNDASAGTAESGRALCRGFCKAFPTARLNPGASARNGAEGLSEGAIS